ncbi:LysR family transcriptional regulator [Candidimonas sp. SYP-B2681]|uniref:LysR family transcriptional regulator n=1 Tax=Candidimonas sp. SYP-B2681 TaxID=2497686 RepID=UPI000F85F087|nr:LysR family transcriptional regulator [Candidimonas sp. SYP-B2681]RTZ45505.1 LysR family transcriptional regulator [Candidimonas sp. SYP-B2681]
MDLKQLEYFARVVEEGSFSKAAAALNLSQPSVSRQINLLEQELGQKLFERTGRGVLPTAAGTTLLGHARTMLNSAAQATFELKELRDEPTGTIIVGMPNRLAVVFAVPLILAFRKALPFAKISIVEGLSPYLRDNLIEGSADVALLFVPKPTPLLSYERLHQDTLVLVAPRHVNLPPTLKYQSLPEYELVLPSTSKPIRNLVDEALAANGGKLNIVAEVGAVQTALRVVESGVACSIIPKSALTLKAPDSGIQVAELTDPTVSNDLFLALPKSRPISRLTLETCRIIRALPFS